VVLALCAAAVVAGVASFTAIAGPLMSLMSVVPDRRLIGCGRRTPSWVVGRVLWDC
jgi:hypothetical protein